MPGIHVGSTESIDSALKRFKKQVEKGGILSEVRRREYYSTGKVCGQHCTRPGSVSKVSV